MTKEKVMYVRLPEGAKYRKVKVTADGEIAISYTEECNEGKVTPIPKPVSLIGGTAVYQKDNGTEYWYCKIKGGRDEFMHLYFGDLTEEDLLYDANGRQREFITDRQKDFKANILKALKNKPEEGFRWLPVYEPSSDGNGNVKYVSRETVLTGLDSYEWEEILKNYSPQNGSREAPITTYFLLLLRWLKDGLATIKQLADNPEDIFGNCWNCNIIEKTGEREFAGLYGMTVNTYKEVKDTDSETGFSLLGGRHDGKDKIFSLTNIVHNSFPNYPVRLKVGLLELTK